MAGMPIDPVFEQTGYRFYADFYPWGEVPLAPYNQSPAVVHASQQVRLRFLITEQGHNVEGVWVQFGLEYRVDGSGGTNFGPWADCSTSDIYFDALTGSSYNNNTTTTQVLGSGTFLGGDMCWILSDAFSAVLTPFPSGWETEDAWAIKFNPFAAGARFQFRLTLNTDSAQYDVAAAFNPMGLYAAGATPEILVGSGTAGVGQVSLPSLNVDGPFRAVIPRRPKTICETVLAPTLLAASASDRIMPWAEPSRGPEWWSAGTPNRIVVPAGVNFVTINGSRRDDIGQGSVSIYTYLALNGVQQDEVKTTSTYWNQAQHFFSGAVTPGDYFEFHCTYNGGNWQPGPLCYFFFCGWEI